MNLKTLGLLDWNQSIDDLTISFHLHFCFNFYFKRSADFGLFVDWDNIKKLAIHYNFRGSVELGLDILLQLLFQTVGLPSDRKWSYGNLSFKLYEYVALFSYTVYVYKDYNSRSQLSFLPSINTPIFRSTAFCQLPASRNLIWNSRDAIENSQPQQCLI